MLGRPLGTDADFKISELRGKRMSAMVVWEPQKSDPKKKTIKLASLRHVPVAGAAAAPKRDVTTLSAEPSEEDVDRALAVQGLKKSVERLKKLDKEAGAAAQHAYDASDLDTAPIEDIQDLWAEVKASIAKALAD